MSKLPEESNIITLRSVFKIPKVTLQPAKHPVTGRYADSVRRVNSQGDIQETEDDRKTGRYVIGENEDITIFDGKTFDLNNEIDAAWWDAIKDSRRIALDRTIRDTKGNFVIDGNLRRYGSAEFYVEHLGQVSKMKVSLREQRHNAESFVFGDSHDGLYQKARLLGNPMTQLPLSDVKEYLLDLAKETPDVIINLYTGADTNLRILLLDALDRFVIQYRDKVYQYGENQILGLNQDAVIQWFKNPMNKRILDIIKQQTYPEHYAELEVEIDPNDYTGEELISMTKTTPKKAKA